MIHKCIVLFCDNEHGTGSPSFPDLDQISTAALEQELIKDQTVGQVRKAAKKAGWGRVNGGDYCPICMEGGI